MTARFTVEKTLGKLAKWLRILGFDACSEPCGSMGSNAQAVSGRILLTRTRRRCRELQGRSFVLIRSNDPFDQLKEVICGLSLSPLDIRPFSRCLLCNEPTEPVSKDAVCHLVPDFVWESHERFCRCGRCQKIYWSGSHTERGMRRIDALFEDPKPIQLPHGSDS
ncbi:MAG: Mut7-C RNAse domain-containing protein [Desulfobacterales bacterium]|nr:Mut7-C RNAse domain-containing protein [Desulfobacterales bacterium]